MRLMKQVFEELNIPYLVGGSIASAIHGIPRTTHDVDFVADVKAEHVPALVAALEAECYVDAEMIYEALRERSLFNVLHLSTMHKADVFPLEFTPWALEVWARHKAEPFRSGEEMEMIPIASPEDLVLQKLAWYRLGGGVSDRQWGDVTGILKVQAEALDLAYLRHWAADLGLTDLLLKAYEDAGIEDNASGPDE